MNGNLGLTLNRCASAQDVNLRSGIKREKKNLIKTKEGKK